MKPVSMSFETGFIALRKYLRWPTQLLMIFFNLFHLSSSVFFHLLYHPILYISLCRVKVDTNFRYRFVAEIETLAIVFEIDLLHCSLSTLIKFQFYDVT